MTSVEIAEKKANRQCWECLKRRLVCDHTLPHCKKCQKLGKECPGYDDQKPLHWIQPGTVTCRRRKKDSPPKVYTIPLRESTRRDSRDLEQQQTTAASTPIDPIFDLVQSQSLFAPWKSSIEEEWGYLAEKHHEKGARELTFLTGTSAGILDMIFNIGGKNKLERIVKNGLREEAAGMLPLESQPLERLERTLRIMKQFDIPDYNYLRNETNEVVQAVSYCTYLYMKVVLGQI
jgi:hypothetical protein